MTEFPPFAFLLFNLCLFIFFDVGGGNRGVMHDQRGRGVVHESLHQLEPAHCLPVHLMASSPIRDTTQDPKQCWTSCFYNVAKQDSKSR